MKEQETSLLPVCPGLVSFLVFHSVLFCFSPSMHKYQSDPVAISKGQQQSSVNNGRGFCALRGLEVWNGLIVTLVILG